MDDLALRMAETLLDLAFTAQGRTASWDSGGGGTPDYTPIKFDKHGDVQPLDRFDDPAGFYADRWDNAEDDAEREHVLADAQRHLKHLLRGEGGLGGTTTWESLDDLKGRIVAEGEGWPAREVANRFRCGIRLVYVAREEASRETEHGLHPRNGRDMTDDERRVEAERLSIEGASERQIAAALSIHRNAVRRLLGRTTS